VGCLPKLRLHYPWKDDLCLPDLRLQDL
jgi:hypothetical protein